MPIVEALGSKNVSLSPVETTDDLFVCTNIELVGVTGIKCYTLNRGRDIVLGNSRCIAVRGCLFPTIAIRLAVELFSSVKNIIRVGRVDL